MSLEAIAILDAFKKSFDLFKGGIEFARESGEPALGALNSFIYGTVEQCRSIVSDYYDSLNRLEDGLSKNKTHDEHISALLAFQKDREKYILVRRQLFAEFSILLKESFGEEFDDVCAGVIYLLDFSENKVSLTCPSSIAPQVMEKIHPELFGNEERKVVLDRIKYARNLLEERWIYFISKVTKFELLYSAGRHDLLSDRYSKLSKFIKYKSKSKDKIKK
jgi:hypothetical protein